jgi:hypothetical protein
MLLVSQLCAQRLTRTLATRAPVNGLRHIRGVFYCGPRGFRTELNPLLEVGKVAGGGGVVVPVRAVQLMVGRTVKMMMAVSSNPESQ